MPLMRGFSRSDHGRALMGIDLGSVHDGGTHWSVGDVAILGGGSVLIVFILALAIRRIWAMQTRDPSE